MSPVIWVAIVHVRKKGDYMLKSRTLASKVPAVLPILPWPGDCRERSLRESGVITR